LLDKEFHANARAVRCQAAQRVTPRQVNSFFSKSDCKVCKSFKLDLWKMFADEGLLWVDADAVGRW